MANDYDNPQTSFVHITFSFSECVIILEPLIYLNNFMKVIIWQIGMVILDSHCSLKWYYHHQGFRFKKCSNARIFIFLSPDYSPMVLILRMFSWLKIVHDCYHGSILEFLPACLNKSLLQWRMIWFNDKWLIHFGMIILVFSEIHFCLWR